MKIMLTRNHDKAKGFIFAFEKISTRNTQKGTPPIYF